MAFVEAVITKCVEDIFKEYDKDESGLLDKEETRSFLEQTLQDMEGEQLFSEEEFDRQFKYFDKDGSGTIDKEEMVALIKRVCDLGVSSDEDDDDEER